MTEGSKRMLLSNLIDDIKRHLHLESKPEEPDSDDPDAPFSMVGARVKPRTPLGRSSIAIQPEP